jgi:uncharacterized protein (TIGR02996 family)
MSPDNPFLRALLAQPDDDTLRLAMADWLDENGQPARAEFIRVQVELAAGVSDTTRRRELERRQRDLLVFHETEWVSPLARVLGCKPGVWGGWVFRRGFVEYFHLPGSAVNRRGHLLARLTPVRELFLRPVTPQSVSALVKHPWGSGLTHLYLDGLRLTNTVALTLIHSVYFHQLKVLRLGPDGTTEPIGAALRQKFPFMVTLSR